MSQQLLIGRAVKIVQSRHEFPKSDECDIFFKLQLVVTDATGNKTTITIFSDTELRIEEES